MAPRTDHTTRIASPDTTNHPAKGSVFVELENSGNLKTGTYRGAEGLLEPFCHDEGDQMPEMQRLRRGSASRVEVEGRTLERGFRVKGFISQNVPIN